ncbi:MAG: hypothetical protein EBZ91_11240 [Gammaproteobacteria bacterium]|nr:hypothetical protein [Gammaproteobacteria bacterium]
MFSAMVIAWYAAKGFGPLQNTEQLLAAADMLRQMAVLHMRDNPRLYDQDFRDQGIRNDRNRRAYMAEMERYACYGDAIAMRAAANVLNMRVRVYTPSKELYNLIAHMGNGRYVGRLYLSGDHYKAIVAKDKDLVGPGLIQNFYDSLLEPNLPGGTANANKQPSPPRPSKRPLNQATLPPPKRQQIGNFLTPPLPPPRPKVKAAQGLRTSNGRVQKPVTRRRQQPKRLQSGNFLTGNAYYEAMKRAGPPSPPRSKTQANYLTGNAYNPAINKPTQANNLTGNAYNWPSPPRPGKRPLNQATLPPPKRQQIGNFLTPPLPPPTFLFSNFLMNRLARQYMTQQQPRVTEPQRPQLLTGNAYNPAINQPTQAGPSPPRPPSPPRSKNQANERQPARFQSGNAINQLLGTNQVTEQQRPQRPQRQPARYQSNGNFLTGNAMNQAINTELRPSQQPARSQNNTYMSTYSRDFRHPATIESGGGTRSRSRGGTRSRSRGGTRSRSRGSTRSRSRSRSGTRSGSRYGTRSRSRSRSRSGKKR